MEEEVGGGLEKTEEDAEKDKKENRRKDGGRD